jgi:nicotinamidase-related amidase
MATAVLAVQLDTSGRLTSAATSTALDDALKELGTTRTTVLGLPATVRQDRAVRDETLAVLDDCVSAVSVATEAVSSEDGRPSMAETGALLESAAARLSGLESRLGSP